MTDGNGKSLCVQIVNALIVFGEGKTKLCRGESLKPFEAAEIYGAATIAIVLGFLVALAVRVVCLQVSFWYYYSRSSPNG